MKMASVLALASSANAAYFGVMVSRSASPIHLQSVNAAEDKLWTGKDTAAFCFITPTSCPLGDETLFDPEGVAGTLGMAVNVPGGQGVYVEKDGTVGYKKPHSGVLPEDAVGKGWKCSPPAAGASYGYLKFNGHSFLACASDCDSPEEGPWQVYVEMEGAKFDKEKCIAFTALAVTGP